MSIDDDTSPEVVGTRNPPDRRSLLRNALNANKGFFDALYRLPTTVLALLLFSLLAFNALSIFSVRVSLPPERTRASATVMYAVRADDLLPVAKTHLPVLRKDGPLALPGRNLSFYRPRRAKRRKLSLKIDSLTLRSPGNARFSARLKAF